MPDELVSPGGPFDSPTAIEYTGDSATGSVAGLSHMVGRQIKIGNLNIQKVTVRDIPDLFGGPKALIVGVYLSITGWGGGHMIIVYQPDTAFELIDMILGQPDGSPLQRAEKEQSVLAKVSNVMGSFFLNHLDRSLGMDIRPSTSAAMVKMAGAILISDISDIMVNRDYAYVLKTTFSGGDRQVAGTFLVVSSQKAAVIGG